MIDNSVKNQTTIFPKTFNPLEIIKAACDLMLIPGKTYELRCPNTPKKTLSGYFSDFSKLSLEASNLSGVVPTVYVTLNPVDDSLLGRAWNRIEVFAKNTTADEHIARLRRLLIDLDPVRPTGISSSDAEHTDALTVAKAVSDWLSEQGFPLPLYADSGNGGHLVYGLDLPAADSELVSAFLQALAKRFNTPTVTVDLTTFNPSRISKVYGTMACKGDSIPDRPHRLARIISAPSKLDTVPRELLVKIVGQEPVQPQQEQHHQESSTLPKDADSLLALLAKHGAKIKSGRPWGKGYRWVLESCPFDAAHTDDAAVVTLREGRRGFKCHHNGCGGKNWQALMKLWGDDKPPQDDSPQQDTIHFTRWHELREQAQNTKHHYLVDQLLEFGSLNMFHGLSWSGKSVVVAHQAACIIQGIPFFSYKTQRAPILYVNADYNPASLIYPRLARALTDELAHELMQQYFFLLNPDEMPERLTADFLAKAIKQLGSQLGQGVIYIDTLRSATFTGAEKGSEVDTVTMMNVLRPFQHLAKQSNWAIQVLHHNSRYNEDYAGAGSIPNLLHSMWGYKRNKREAEGKLTITTRDLMPLDLYITQSPNGLLTAKQDKAPPAPPDPQQAEIINSFPETASAALTLKQIMELPVIKERNLSQTAARSLLKDCESPKLIPRLLMIGEGKKNSPYQWFKTS